MMTLIQRLRKRRVFRGAGYYVLGAWAALQVGDVVVEPAGLPPWSMTALLYLLVLGFPLAMFLSWRYDITEHGIVRTTASSEEGMDPALLRPRAADYVVLVLVVGILGFGAYRSLILARQAGEAADEVASAEATATAPLDSIAVLPFADLSPGVEKTFLGDGISDTVTHVLSQVDGISVIARTSSFAFKDRNLPVQEIAAALGVAHVLEGSVQRAGEKLRIIARLINAVSGAEVWSGYYDRGMEAIFAIQDEIAQEVATALRVNVLGEGDVEVEGGYQPDLRAFEAFILGREALDKGDAESIAAAREHFQRAVDIDPDYALAYVMLAQATVMHSPGISGSSRRERLEKAAAINRKALDIDPLLPEAHVNQAGYLRATKDFAGAERAARRALELSPSHAPAFQALQALYDLKGQYDEALEMARRAAELDPEDERYQLTLARALWNVGRSEAAITTIKRVVRRNPDSLGAIGSLSRYLRQIGRSGEALYWDERALELDATSPGRQFAVCLGILQLWDVEGALACIERHLEKYPDDPEARQYRAHLTFDTEAGIANAEAQVAANPKFWYRKMQLVEWLVIADRHEEAIGMVRESFPDLFENPPVVQNTTIWVARSLAMAYHALGDRARLESLANAALDFISTQRKLQGTGLASGIDDVYFLALLGRVGEAVDRLREAIDRDWQFFSFGLLFPQTLPEALVEDPGFREQVERLSKIMAEERAWYEANREGDLLNQG